MKTVHHSPHDNEKKYVLPIEQGGTGAKTAQEALANLGGIDPSAINTPGGFLGLNESGLIDPIHIPPGVNLITGVCLDGPTEVREGNPFEIKITNYDIFTVYELGVIGCTARQIEDVIQVTPTQEEGSIIVNGSQFFFTAEINKPINSELLGGSNTHSYYVNAATRRFGEVVSIADSREVSITSPDSSLLDAGNVGRLDIFNTAGTLQQTFTPIVGAVSIQANIPNGSILVKSSDTAIHGTVLVAQENLTVEPNNTFVELSGRGPVGGHDYEAPNALPLDLRILSQEVPQTFARPLKKNGFRAEMVVGTFSNDTNMKFGFEVPFHFPIDGQIAYADVPDQEATSFKIGTAIHEGSLYLYTTRRLGVNEGATILPSPTIKITYEDGGVVHTFDTVTGEVVGFSSVLPYGINDPDLLNGYCYRFRNIERSGGGYSVPSYRSVTRPASTIRVSNSTFTWPSGEGNPLDVKTVHIDEVELPFFGTDTHGCYISFTNGSKISGTGRITTKTKNGGFDQSDTVLRPYWARPFQLYPSTEGLNYDVEITDYPTGLSLNSGGVITHSKLLITYSANKIRFELRFNTPAALAAYTPTNPKLNIVSRIAGVETTHVFNLTRVASNDSIIFETTGFHLSPTVTPVASIRADENVYRIDFCRDMRYGELFAQTQDGTVKIVGSISNPVDQSSTIDVITFASDMYRRRSTIKRPLVSQVHQLSIGNQGDWFATSEGEDYPRRFGLYKKVDEDFNDSPYVYEPDALDASSLFGYRVKAASKANVAVVTAPGANKAYLFSYGDLQVNEGEVIVPPANYSDLGREAAISSDGTKIALTYKDASNKVNVAIFQKVNDIWSPTTTLAHPSDLTAAHGFGSSIAFDDDFTVAAIAAPGSVTLSGKVFVFFNGTQNWEHFQTLEGDEAAVGFEYGSSMDFIKNGSLLLIGVPGDNTDTYTSGRVHLYGGRYKRMTA